MKTNIRWIVPILVLLAVGGIVISKSGRKNAALPPPSSSQETDPAVCDTIADAAAPETSAPTAEKTALPRFLELGSVGCRPCDMMVPILEELRKEYQGQLSVEFYDVRIDPTPARQFGIRVIPTQIFLDSRGKEVFRHEGYFPKENILPILAQMGVTK